MSGNAPGRPPIPSTTVALPSAVSASTSSVTSPVEGAVPSGPPPTPPSTSTNPEAEAAVALIRKRIATFSFLRRSHEGRAHCFNTALLTTDNLAPLAEGVKIKKRCMRWFTLGLSIGGLLDVDNHVDYLRALLLLVQEYEHYTEKAFSTERMKRIFSRRRSRLPDNVSNPFAVQLSVSDAGEYTYLDVRNVAFELDYFQVLYTLCDIMSDAYAKILESPALINMPGFPEALQKVDNKLKKIISVVTAELERFVLAVITDELRALDPLRGLGTRTEDEFSVVEASDEGGNSD